MSWRHEAGQRIHTAYTDLQNTANTISHNLTGGNFELGDWWTAHSPALNSIRESQRPTGRPRIVSPTGSPLVQTDNPFHRDFRPTQFTQLPGLAPRQSGYTIMPYRRRRRVRRRYGRRYGRRYRRRTYRRKTRRWGTRVRRAAIKLAESKRLVTVKAKSTLQPGAVYVLFAQDLTNPLYARDTTGHHDVSDVKSRRMGRYVTATGLGIQLHLKNLQASTATFARCIIGYKKIDRADTQNSDFTADDKKLFKQRRKEANCTLQEFVDEGSEANYMAIHAQIDRKYFKAFFDKTWRLEGVDNDMMNHVNTRIYIPLHNRPQKFEAESDLVPPTVTTSDWMMTIYLYCCDAEMNVVTTTNIMEYSFTSTYYFRDIN